MIAKSSNLVYNYNFNCYRSWSWSYSKRDQQVSSGSTTLHIPWYMRTMYVHMYSLAIAISFPLCIIDATSKLKRQKPLVLNQWLVMEAEIIYGW